MSLSIDVCHRVWPTPPRSVPRILFCRKRSEQTIHGVPRQRSLASPCCYKATNPLCRCSYGFVKSDHGRHTSRTRQPPSRPLAAASGHSPTAAPRFQWGANMKDLCVSVGIGAVMWLAPPPEGVSLLAWHLLSVFTATIVAIITAPLPLGAVAVLGESDAHP